MCSNALIQFAWDRMDTLVLFKIFPVLLQYNYNISIIPKLIIFKDWDGENHNNINHAFFVFFENTAPD